MPRYIVQGTHIKHGEKGDKKAKIYAPGVEIELTEEQAKLLGKSVRPVQEKKSSEQSAGKPKDKK